MRHLDRPDFSTYGFSCVRWTAATMPRSDRHNEVELNLLERGSLTYVMGGRKVHVTAGRLTAFWAGIPHQVLGFDDLSDYFVMTIPLAWLLQWRLADDFTQPILHGAMLAEPDQAQDESDRARFSLWSEDLAGHSEERRRASILEVEARLRRLALSVGAQRQVRSLRNKAVGQQQLTRAEEMASFIAQNYAEPLTARMIGEHVGLHPNYAMSLFQRTFGTTLNRYVTEHRLAHTQRLLVTSDGSILDIAFSSGFGSLSRFNEAFRVAFGCTPREYRKRHQSA